MRSEDTEQRSQEILRLERYGRPVAIQLREFGAVVALILCLVAGYLAYKGSVPSMSLSLVATALLVWAVGIWAPLALYPAWNGWMALAAGLSVVMTFLILGVMWLLLMIPTALLLRMFGKQVIDLSFRSGRESYWLTPAAGRDDFKRLERQY